MAMEEDVDGEHHIEEHGLGPGFGPDGGSGNSQSSRYRGVTWNKYVVPARCITARTPWVYATQVFWAWTVQRRAPRILDCCTHTANLSSLHQERQCTFSLIGLMVLQSSMLTVGTAWHQRSPTHCCAVLVLCLAGSVASGRWGNTGRGWLQKDYKCN